ncbi:hypothetical protein GURKE_01020 [Brevundimonas phage vB_BpoS-Gurke]|uniref:Uncharacterized protein n=1 Tax=Brevundimonas phage vB_BpoS-Gurke TaxID=2948599 RepID=A0A9E7N1Q9_9CAUD|nr:hypothetical protein GURKE_01020 [Brevundimonas phage vB_BpoS-Gurke]
MTQTPTLTPSEQIILSRLVKAKKPLDKAGLMEGVTENDASFKVILSKLRNKGFDIATPRGQGVVAAYTLADDSKVRAKAALK